VDQPVGELVYGRRHAVALAQHNGVVCWYGRIEQGFRRGAEERVDRLVVVTREDEILCVLPPVSQQPRLHRIQILRLISKDHRRTSWRDAQIVKAIVNEIAEIQQSGFALVFRPRAFKGADICWPVITGASLHPRRIDRDRIAAVEQANAKCPSNPVSFRWSFCCCTFVTEAIYVSERLRSRGSTGAP